MKGGEMKQIKVLGSGCASCKKTMAMIEKIAREKGVPIELKKIEDMQEIIQSGALATPAVLVNGELVHAGGVPGRDKIAGWLNTD